MSDIRVFIDIGSTFTKAVAFDLDAETYARVQAPSTVETDVNVGLCKVLDELRHVVPVGEDEIRRAVACSSAAGGLRLAVIGLVSDYTTKAGRLAALGAGAKIVGEFSYELSRSEARKLDEIAPDIVLLTGGTDGGNRKTIIHNAVILADSSVTNIIVAGNKSARDEIENAFAGTDKNVSFAANVMPEFGQLEFGSVNERIREVFLERIMYAKGIMRAREIIGEVAMPTPAAVFEAAQLLADGTHKTPGLGELLLIDVGGATTDVYSAASGAPEIGSRAILSGIAEPYMKRTVEGDLGLFHNLDTLARLAGINEDDENMYALLKRRGVPDGEESARLRERLSRAAVSAAVSRHVGHLQRVITGDGEVWAQRGKDLRGIKYVIGAGGPLAFARDPRAVLQGAVGDGKDGILSPRAPKFALDAGYILFAAGLLSIDEPDKALAIIKKHMTYYSEASTEDAGETPAHPGVFGACQ